ncbi:MAG: hypothetical protein DDG60_03270 [Anaerolineae bacterium]|nr:MAG: hypothetical protein DDG60_03270 [Anaerolineae bacterium]
MKRNAAILLSLLLLIGLPPVGYGYFNRFEAELVRATAPARAWRYYQTAAQLLFWEQGLYEQAGLTAFDAGELEHALSLLLEAQARQSLTPQARLVLGEVYYRQGNFDAAYTHAWLPLWKIGFAAPLLFTRLAEYAATKEDAALEVLALQRLIELERTNAFAHYRLALLLALEDPQMAIFHLKQSAHPQAKHLQTALQNALTFDDSAYRHLLVGRALASVGEWRLALRSFRAATEQNPQYAEGWAWQAEALYQLGEPAAQVQAFYQQALALNPNAAGIQAMVGLYQERMRDYPRAEAHYRRAVQLEPENPAWRLALARILAHRDLPAALEQYQMAVRLAPEQVEGWLALAAFCVEKEAFLEEVGLEAALHAYALQPENPDVLDLLGRALALTGQVETAQVFYERAIGLEPLRPSTHFYLALLYFQTGQSYKARELFQQVARLDPAGAYGRQAADILARYFP